MKKTILLTVALAATVAFAACNKKNNEENQSEMMEIQAAMEIPEWEGVYEGTIAQADGAGFASTLELKEDSVFVLTQAANGGEADAETINGTYEVDPETNIVTLTAADGMMVQKFLYEGASVVMVDMEGNMPEMAEMYRLMKKMN